MYILYTVHTYYMHWVLRTHNVRVCLYIVYIACGSISLYIKKLYFFICTFFMLAAATVANIKIRYDAKTPKFAIFGTRVLMCVLQYIHTSMDIPLYLIHPKIENFHRLNIEYPINWTFQQTEHLNTWMLGLITLNLPYIEHFNTLNISIHWKLKYTEYFNTLNALSPELEPPIH